MTLAHDPAAMRAVQKYIDEHPEIYAPTVYGKGRRQDVLPGAPVAEALTAEEERVMLRKRAIERELETLAKARAARTGETYEAAYAGALMENPALYQRYSEIR